MAFFQYGNAEISYLSKRDPLLAAAIDKIGLIRREVKPDLFTALISSIVSQQISSKGAETVWRRLTAALGDITPENIQKTSVGVIQKCGMSMRKAGYIKELAQTVCAGGLDLAALHLLPDDEVCETLSGLHGIGVWTAEMLMTFCMQRKDIMSYKDLAIHRGLRMLYRHRKITKELFQKYRRRYSPYATVACLYLWELAGGGYPGYSDPAPMTKAQKAAKRKKAAKMRTSAKEKLITI